MKHLTPQEEAIMLQVWEIGECSIKTVWEKMEEPKSPYTTVASTFDKLVNKEYLKRGRIGNVKMYVPKISEAAYKRHFLSDVVKSYFDDSYKELVSFLQKSRRLRKKSYLR